MSDFILSCAINAASKSMRVVVQVFTNCVRPIELIFERPLTTIPVRGRVRPVKVARPASEIFLQYEMSKKVRSFNLDINLTVWSSTAFSQPESCNSCKLVFCLSKSYSADPYIYLQSQKSTLNNDFKSLKASAKNWFVTCGILLRLSSYKFGAILEIFEMKLFEIQ